MRNLAPGIAAASLLVPAVPTDSTVAKHQTPGVKALAASAPFQAPQQHQTTSQPMREETNQSVENPTGRTISYNPNLHRPTTAQPTHDSIHANTAASVDLHRRFSQDKLHGPAVTETAAAPRHIDKTRSLVNAVRYALNKVMPTLRVNLSDKRLDAVIDKAIEIVLTNPGARPLAEIPHPKMKAPATIRAINIDSAKDERQLTTAEIDQVVTKALEIIDLDINVNIIGNDKSIITLSPFTDLQRGLSPELAENEGLVLREADIRTIILENRKALRQRNREITAIKARLAKALKARAKARSQERRTRRRPQVAATHEPTAKPTFTGITEAEAENYEAEYQGSLKAPLYAEPEAYQDPLFFTDALARAKTGNETHGFDGDPALGDLTSYDFQPEFPELPEETEAQIADLDARDRRGMPKRRGSRSSVRALYKYAY